MELPKKHIEEINQHISDALEQWQDVMMIADADEWAYHLNYSDNDLLNALYIFNHVAGNICIKSGVFTQENVEEKMEAFRKAVSECYEFDTIELANKVLKNENKD